MKQIPILFSTPMVQAILNNSKTKTRRTRLLEDIVIDEDSGYVFLKKHKLQLDIHTWKDDILQYCPYGLPGDVLWVRETFAIGLHSGFFYFKANGDKANGTSKWKPSIHMPKAAARIWLEIVSVKVERLQDITVSDAVSEGINSDCFDPCGRFQGLWKQINGVESWDSNPWVWCVTFRKIEKP